MRTVDAKSKPSECARAKRQHSKYSDTCRAPLKGLYNAFEETVQCLLREQYDMILGLPGGRLSSENYNKAILNQDQHQH